MNFCEDWPIHLMAVAVSVLILAFIALLIPFAYMDYQDAMKRKEETGYYNKQKLDNEYKVEVEEK